LIRIGLLVGNPCEALERPKTTPGVPKGLIAEDIQLLAVAPHSRTGLRGRAIILTLTFTGRRRAEVMGLKAGNLTIDGDMVQYTSPQSTSSATAPPSCAETLGNRSKT
jgi:site-specific recombinase XerD